jgi:hypothetical protein
MHRSPESDAAKSSTEAEQAGNSAEQRGGELGLECGDLAVMLKLAGAAAISSTLLSGGDRHTITASALPTFTLARCAFRPVAVNDSR